MSRIAQLLTATCITSFMNPFMGTALTVAVPDLAAEYEVEPHLVTYLISTFTICVASSLLPASAIANRLGYRQAYATGVLCAALCSVLITLTPTFILLMLARGLQGMTFALAFCTGTALLFDQAPRERRGMVVAIQTAAVYSGMSCAPLLSGVIIEHLNWRMVFYMAAAAQLTSFFLIRRIPRDQPNTDYLPLPRLLLAFAAVFTTLTSLTFLREHALCAWTLGLGVALVAAFLILEARTARGIFPVRTLMHNRVLNLALGAATCNYMATFAISLLLALHLQLIMGFSPSFTGVFLITQPIFMTACSLLAGRLSGRVPPHLLTGSGMALTAAALLCMSGIDAHSPLWEMALMQALAGIGFGLFSATNTAIVMGSVERTLYAVVSGLHSLSRNFGMALGMAGLGLILSLHISAPSGTTLYLYELAHSLSVSFIFQGAVCILGVVCCVLGYQARRTLSPG